MSETIYEFVVAAKDEEDLESGHKRKKQGDIISYKPAPWGWGRKEVTGFLIVLGKNISEEWLNVLKCSHYNDGSYGEEAKNPDISERMESTQYQIGEQVTKNLYLYVATQGGTSSSSAVDFPITYGNIFNDGSVIWKCLGKAKPQTVGKRRFRIPMEVITDGYYPDLDLDRVADKEDNYQPLKDNNIVIDFSEKVSIIKDLHKNSFRYNTKKTI